MTAPARPNIVQTKGSFESFGAVLDFLTRIDPFSRYQAGELASAIRRQLALGHHVLAVGPNGALVGYAGWLRTSTHGAELWMAGDSPLAAQDDGDAAALTIVAASERSAVPLLIRGCRDRNPNIQVYFKRRYTEGPGERKAKVRNLQF